MNKEQIQVIVLISMFTIGFFVGFTFIMVKPSSNQLSSLNKKLDKIAKEIRENQSIANKQESVEKEIKLKEKKIKHYKKTVLSLSEFDFFKDTLKDMADEYNVKVSRSNTSTLKDDNKSVFKGNLNFTEKIIKLNIKCGYHNFGNFINRIENTSPFRKITAFSIKKSGRRSRNSDSESNLLTISLSILSLLKENNL